MSPIKSVAAATHSDLEKIKGKGRRSDPSLDSMAELLRANQPAKVDIELAEKETEKKFRSNISATLKRRGIESTISKIESEGGEGHLTLIVQSRRKEGE
jgi:hypothetical protein